MTALTFRGGRIHAQPARPKLKLGDYLTAGPFAVPPATADWLSAVGSWPMYLNDQLGDCTCAAVGHMIEAATQYASGTALQITDQDVLTAYEAVGGYVPGQPSTDNGAYIQDVLAYWHATGVGGDHIVAYASVDVANLDEVHEAIDMFGCVDIGFNFPASAMDQFNAGQPWDVVAGAQIEGGHCVNVGAYDSDAKTLTCVTWGRTQVMTEAFWHQYVDEAWVIITHDWVNANGIDPLGIDLYQLGADFQQLTGQPNPIPAPAPSPTPAPIPPQPGPAPVPQPPAPSGFSLDALDGFKAAPGFSDAYKQLPLRSFYAPVDDVHGALKAVLGSVTQSLTMSMFGFDDPELADMIKALMQNPAVAVKLVLDRSQSRGVHEREILAHENYPNTMVAIGNSEDHAIIHLKEAVVDHRFRVSGSTNLSASGETKQDDELTVLDSVAAAAEAEIRIEQIFAFIKANEKG